MDKEQKQELCVICGRGPHPNDDPECVPPSADLSARLAFMVARAERAERALDEANRNWGALARAQQERAESAEERLRKWEPTIDDMRPGNTLPVATKEPS